MQTTGSDTGIEAITTAIAIKNIGADGIDVIGMIGHGITTAIAVTNIGADIIPTTGTIDMHRVIPNAGLFMDVINPAITTVRTVVGIFIRMAVIAPLTTYPMLRLWLAA